MAEMSELCCLASALVKNTLERRKVKNQKKLTLHTSIAETKELGPRVSQVKVAIEEIHECSENMQETFYQLLNVIKELK